ncbi:M24 family metallopeptidase [Sphaerisporangium siamense]|uniref:Xaa-Pro dipeptidase n=1 Tax=Sphaerisporangium siamense TaxID=795645 RepID=A0A7W7DAY9_9ACTN|nr:M24 family metallopeptidase [Sphaerisporangium siamense]MBB4702650.1 Xaa-Pro dipeptidase [Sphaerisporangium siamense]
MPADEVRADEVRADEVRADWSPADGVPAAVLAAMAEAGLDALVLRSSTDLRYVAGHDASGFLVLAPGRPPGFATEAARAAALIPRTASRVAVDPEMRVRELFALGLTADLVLASAVLAPLRAVKRPEELAAIARAAAAADLVLATAPHLRWFGGTERAMAARLAGESGASGLVSVVVAAGENTARPRHLPGERVINPGDAVTIRVTARHEGYHAHAGRAFVVAEPPEDFDAVYAVLLAARDAAADAVRPGTTAADVHAAAEAVLDESGYGAYVSPGLGHGVGLEPVEGLRLAADDRTVLAPGMTMIVEPGIHVPDLYGARVGDVVECTETGARAMTRAPGALLVLDP